MSTPENPTDIHEALQSALDKARRKGRYLALAAVAWVVLVVIAALVFAKTNHDITELKRQTEELGQSYQKEVDDLKLQSQTLNNDLSKAQQRMNSLAAKVDSTDLSKQVTELKGAVAQLKASSAMISGTSSNYNEGIVQVGELQIVWGRIELQPTDPKNKTARSGNRKFKQGFREPPTVVFSLPAKAKAGEAIIWGCYQSTITKDDLSLLTVYPIKLSAGLSGFYAVGAEAASDVEATYIAIGRKK
jgi:uncharacterized protein YoxC